MGDSDLPEEQLAYALVSKPNEEQMRLQSLHQIYQNNPNNEIVQHGIISECAINAENSICSEELIDNLLQTNKDDGAFWLAAASYYAKNSDDQMYEAIARLDSSNHFGNNYAKRIKLYMQATGNRQSSHFGFNLMNAIAVEAANSLGYLSPLTTWCKTGLEDSKRSSACLVLGRNMEKRPSTLIEQHLGLAIQKKVYEADGNTEMVNALDQQTKQIMKNMSENRSPYTDLLILTNEALARDWLDNLEILGEYDASIQLQQDINLLLQTEDFEACTALLKSLL